jgi:hypothetical protein
LPLTEMEAANVERLKKSLEDYGIKVSSNQVIKLSGHRNKCSQESK